MNFSPLRDYFDLRGSTANAHYRAYLAQQRISRRTPIFKMVNGLLDANFLPCGSKVAKVLFTRRRPFPDYN